MKAESELNRMGLREMSDLDRIETEGGDALTTLVLFGHLILSIPQQVPDKAPEVKEKK